MLFEQEFKASSQGVELLTRFSSHIFHVTTDRTTWAKPGHPVSLRYYVEKQELEARLPFQATLSRAYPLPKFVERAISSLSQENHLKSCSQLGSQER